MKIPKVFVSYSHDSDSHKKWVLDLATRLMNVGVDARIDQWELKPGDDLPQFMEQNLTTCDYVLMICTDKYVQKANSGIGGVGYEKMIITSELMKKINSNKIIPIIRQEGTRNVPTFLTTKLFIDLSKSDDFEFGFDELIRTIHDAPLYKKPEIGKNPFQPGKVIPPEKTGDAIVNLMNFIVTDFENGEHFSEYDELLEEMNISRILLDRIIADAVRKELISQDLKFNLHLTPKGKSYAIEHKLIKQ
jgi:hypothetical protein